MVTTVVVFPVISNGATASIWVGLSDIITAATSSKKTCVVPSWRGAVPGAALIACAAKPAPLNKSHSPGATLPGSLLAAFTIPDGASDGGGGVTVRVTVTVWVLASGVVKVRVPL